MNLFCTCGQKKLKYTCERLQLLVKQQASNLQIKPESLLQMFLFLAILKEKMIFLFSKNLRPFYLKEKPGYAPLFSTFILSDIVNS